MPHTDDLQYASGKLYPLNFLPGVKRDGTNFASRHWIDGLWNRFQRALPRKIGGYESIIEDLPNIPRGLQFVDVSPNFNAYVADFESLKYTPIDGDGNAIGPTVDRTPAGFIANPSNDWTFESMFSTISDTGIIIAHAAPNLSAIDSTIETSVYYGDELGSAPLIPTGQSVSGGIVVLHPFLFYFSNDGEVKWSEPNNPTVIAGSQRVTANKLVAGLATRGGNSSPAGLLWSLDALIRVTHTGDTDLDFTFDTVAGESSILSSNSVIEFDGVYFWVGVDRFLFYNGTINELPNDKNRNFFFDNLNFSQRQKVWASKVTEFGEIWWHFPFGDDTECSAAIIYNVRENIWNDTGDPRVDPARKFGRSCGVLNPIYGLPVWAGNGILDGAPYNIWQHETGVDKNLNGTITAINAFVTTGSMAWCAVGPDGQFNGYDKTVDLYRIEPDLIQSGDIEVFISGNAYARSPDVETGPYVFSETDEKIDLRETRREMYITFETNVIGGDYQMGQNLVLMRLGDTRP